MVITGAGLPKGLRAAPYYHGLTRDGEREASAKLPEPGSSRSFHADGFLGKFSAEWGLDEGLLTKRHRWAVGRVQLHTLLGPKPGSSLTTKSHSTAQKRFPVARVLGMTLLTCRPCTQDLGWPLGPAYTPSLTYSEICVLKRLAKKLADGHDHDHWSSRSWRPAEGSTPRVCHRLIM